MGFLSKSSKSSEASHSNALAQIAGMPLQAKLRYGQPNDSYEHEADRVADSVVSNTKSARTSAASPALGQGISNTVQKSADEKNNSEINKLDPIQQKAANKEEKPVQKKSTDKQDDQKMLQKKPAEEKKEKPVQKKEAKKDEKPVQKKAANKEEKSVQKKAAGKQEEKPVQKKEAAKKDEKPVQKKEAGQAEDKEGGLSNNRKAEDPSIEQAIMAGKNSGKPMEDDVRKEMEHQFGTDFTHVTIHNDAQAHELCRKINAQAFTHGSHVYFAEGKYDPHTTAGKHLLAHELTHVVQQNGRVQKMVQKAADGKPAPKAAAKGVVDPLAVVDANKYDSKVKGTITKSANAITIPELRIPKFKESFTPTTDLTIRKGRPEGEKRDTNQKTLWEQSTRDGSGLESALKAKFDQAAPFGSASNPVKYMKVGNKTADAANFIVGTKTDIRNRLLRPYWKPSGEIRLFEVDHKLEYQLGGQDAIDNFWLLERTANGSSGRNIAHEIQSKVNGLLNASAKTAIWNNNAPPAFDDVKRNYSITFQKVNPTLPVDMDGNSGKPDTYTESQIKGGTQLSPVIPLSLANVKAAGLTSDPTHLVIFNNATGGRRYRLNIPSATAGEVAFTDPKFLPGFTPTTAKITPDQPTIATLKGALWAKNPLVDKGLDIEIPISAMDGIPNTGLLNVTSLRKKIADGDLHVKPFSPIQINNFDVDGSGELFISGKVNTKIPVIDGADIDIVIRGNDIRIEKTFTAGDFKFPGPVKVPSASITFSIGTESGISVKGDAAIEIKNLASGTITAAAQTGTSKGQDAGFSIAGHLDFDKKLFKKGNASVDVSYDSKNGLAIGGTLTIEPDPKSGIEKASINVQYANKALEASGTATFKIKAIKEASLHIKFGEDVSEIDGDIKIGSLGVIKEGEGQFKVEKKDDQYDVAGSGTVTPNIPGLSSAVAFTFHNDMFSVDVSISDFHYGRISGSLNVGITNEELSDGKPTGKASDNYRAFGESVLKLKVTDKIFATATLTFLETGDMEVKGGITLPEKFEVVPPILDVNNKPIIDIPSINIPLFAIPLGVTDIGLDAVIAPRLTGDAHLGPGYLTNLGVEVDFKTSEPDNLTITGTADFEFMADASITAGVDFDVRANAVIASISGGVGLSGTAGIKAEQPVIQGAVKYSPKTGFELDGEVKAIGKPFLSFKGDLHIKGSAGVWPLKVSHTWTWPIGEKDVSVDAPLGFSFHFGYSNGKADFPSFDQWKWYHPEFNMDLMKKIKAQMIDPIYDEVF